MTRIPIDQPIGANEDFKRDIKNAISGRDPIGKHQIPFRMTDGKLNERDVFEISVDLVRYRKENGRISSDVLPYEHSHTFIDGWSVEMQKQIFQFLEDKDPEATKTLMNSLKANHQKVPAIITCDGFIIDGNRRRMALEKLRIENPNEDRYNFIKVVILPEDTKAIEIIKLENRLQLQKDGKSEYTNLDKAITYRNNEKKGYSLEAQLKDDPNFSDLDTKDFEKAKKAFKKEFLDPLEAADDYLRHIGREGKYNLISGRGTSEKNEKGRWQALVDYSISVQQKLNSDTEKAKLNITSIKEEVAVKEAAFNVIRLREVPKIDKKAHELMRSFPELLKNEEAKKLILEISKLPKDISDEKKVKSDGKPLTDEVIEELWRKENEKDIDYRMNKAWDIVKRRSDFDKPLDLLRDAQSKLNNKKLSDGNLNLILDDLNEARSILVAIRDRVDEIDRAIYHTKKNLDSLVQGRKK